MLLFAELCVRCDPVLEDETEVLPALDGARREAGISAGSNRALSGREELEAGGVAAGLSESRCREGVRGSKSPCLRPACCLGLIGAGAYPIVQHVGVSLYEERRTAE